MKRLAITATVLALVTGIIAGTGGGAQAFGSRNNFNEGCGTTFGFASWQEGAGGVAVSSKGRDGNCAGWPGAAVRFANGSYGRRINDETRATARSGGPYVVGGAHWRALADSVARTIT